MGGDRIMGIGNLGWKGVVVLWDFGFILGLRELGRVHGFIGKWWNGLWRSLGRIFL